MKKQVFKITKSQIDVDRRRANSSYNVPKEASSYSIDIKDNLFNTSSYYSFFLQDDESLEDLNSLGWSTRIYKGRIRIIAVSNADPEYNVIAGEDFPGAISADYEKVQCPTGKSLIVFYEKAD